MQANPKLSARITFIIANCENPNVNESELCKEIEQLGRETEEDGDTRNLFITTPNSADSIMRLLRDRPNKQILLATLILLHHLTRSIKATEILLTTNGVEMVSLLFDILDSYFSSPLKEQIRNNEEIDNDDDDEIHDRITTILLNLIEDDDSEDEKMGKNLISEHLSRLKNLLDTISPHHFRLKVGIMRIMGKYGEKQLFFNWVKEEGIAKIFEVIRSFSNNISDSRREIFVMLSTITDIINLNVEFIPMVKEYGFELILRSFMTISPEDHKISSEEAKIIGYLITSNEDRLYIAKQDKFIEALLLNQQLRKTEVAYLWVIWKLASCEQLQLELANKVLPSFLEVISTDRDDPSIQWYFRTLEILVESPVIATEFYEMKGLESILSAFNFPFDPINREHNTMLVNILVTFGVLFAHCDEKIIYRFIELKGLDILADLLIWQSENVAIEVINLLEKLSKNKKTMEVILKSSNIFHQTARLMKFTKHSNLKICILRFSLTVITIIDPNDISHWEKTGAVRLYIQLLNFLLDPSNSEFTLPNDAIKMIYSILIKMCLLACSKSLVTSIEISANGGIQLSSRQLIAFIDDKAITDAALLVLVLLSTNKRSAIRFGNRELKIIFDFINNDRSLLSQRLLAMTIVGNVFLNAALNDNVSSSKEAISSFKRIVADLKNFKDEEKKEILRSFLQISSDGSEKLALSQIIDLKLKSTDIQDPRSEILGRIPELMTELTVMMRHKDEGIQTLTYYILSNISANASLKSSIAIPEIIRNATEMIRLSNEPSVRLLSSLCKDSSSEIIRLITEKGTLDLILQELKSPFSNTKIDWHVSIASLLYHFCRDSYCRTIISKQNAIYFILKLLRVYADISVPINNGVGEIGNIFGENVHLAPFIVNMIAAVYLLSKNSASDNSTFNSEGGSELIQKINNLPIMHVIQSVNPLPSLITDFPSPSSSSSSSSSSLMSSSSPATKSNPPISNNNNNNNNNKISSTTPKTTINNTQSPSKQNTTSKPQVSTSSRPVSITTTTTTTSSNNSNGGVNSLPSVYKNNNKIPPGRVIWQLDSAVTACNKCKVTFTLFNRRHHCRVCGLIFCNRCCGKRRFGFEEQRTCQKCWIIKD